MYIYTHTSPLGDTIGKSHSTTVVDDLIQFSGTLATPINMCCCILKNGSPIYVYNIRVHCNITYTHMYTWVLHVHTYNNAPV